IRDEAIRAVRERASLSEVISDVVALRRRGRSAVGLCPFHAEKTPSFTVSEERGFFHCFGCGEHGDVFAFLMKAQALTFPEAVRRVAERFGVPLPEEAGEPARRREPLAAANAVAAAFFQAELRGPGGGRARAYLRERAARRAPSAAASCPGGRRAAIRRPSTSTPPSHRSSARATRSTVSRSRATPSARPTAPSWSRATST